MTRDHSSPRAGHKRTHSDLSDPEVKQEYEDEDEGLLGESPSSGRGSPRGGRNAKRHKLTAHFPTSFLSLFDPHFPT